MGVSAFLAVPLGESKYQSSLLESRSNGPELIGQVKKAFEQAIVKMGFLGATIVDPADVPSLDVVSGMASKALARLEFKDTLETYLYTLQENEVRTLEELIA